MKVADKCLMCETGLFRGDSTLTVTRNLAFNLNSTFVFHAASIYMITTSDQLTDCS